MFWATRFGDERERTVAQHLIFQSRGVLRTSTRVGGLKYAVSVQFWKFWQLLKVSVGCWDRDALLATNVMRRCDKLLRHDVTLPQNMHPSGLQIHQDIIASTGRMVSTVFCLLPYGAFFAKVRRAPPSGFRSLVRRESGLGARADVRSSQRLAHLRDR